MASGSRDSGAATIYAGFCIVYLFSAVAVTASKRRGLTLIDFPANIGREDSE
ncbi:hypothetical protein K449DRAFT_392711 [Hypoxylon sp. EC38]|nr:hypothetical protein K449DRAFT_392711 [Hypoxylon sp. EC38]